MAGMPFFYEIKKYRLNQEDYSIATSEKLAIKHRPFRIIPLEPFMANYL
jgi:hypothetical protein